MKRLLTSAALVATVALTGCGGAAAVAPAVPTVAALSTGSASNVSSGSAGRQIKDLIGGSLNLSLYDAPPPWQGAHVNIAIAGVEAVDASNVAHTVVSFRTAQVVDLLALRQSPFSVQGSIPSGSYTGIRLLVDTAKSSLAIGGLIFPMRFATKTRVVAIDAPATFSSSASGVSVTADFNVLESLYVGSTGGQMLPRLVAAANAGAISGTVHNAAGLPVADAAVEAVNANGVVVNTTLTSPTGGYTLRALAPGSYTVKVINHYVAANGTTVDATGSDANAAPTGSVEVSGGSTADGGTLTD